jgi:hypothetical protein
MHADDCSHPTLAFGPLQCESSHGAALQHRILLHFGIPQDGVVSFSLHFGSRFVEVVVVVGDVSLEFFTPDFWGINRPDSA